MADALQVTITTASEEEAEAISSALVERRLAACVQLLGPIRSRYRWQGKVEESREWMLVAKTTGERFPKLESTVRELHSYDEPEIVATRVAAGSEGYLAWIADAVKEYR